MDPSVEPSSTPTTLGKASRSASTTERTTGASLYVGTMTHTSSFAVVGTTAPTARWLVDTHRLRTPSRIFASRSPRGTTGAGSSGYRRSRKPQGAHVPPAASVIVLGYGAEEFLEDALSAVVAELRTGDEVAARRQRHRARRRAPRRAGRMPSASSSPGTNTGFAGGCVEGVEPPRGDVLVFVNSDAILRPGAPWRVSSRRPTAPDVGIAGGCLRLADQPDKVNSVGNPLHYSGITWAGSCGEDADLHREPDRRRRGDRGLLRAAPPRVGRPRGVRPDLLRLPRGHRPVRAQLARRVGGSSTCRMPWPTTTTSSAARRSRCTSWSATG